MTTISERIAEVICASCGDAWPEDFAREAREHAREKLDPSVGEVFVCPVCVQQKRCPCCHPQPETVDVE